MRNKTQMAFLLCAFALVFILQAEVLMAQSPWENTLNVHALSFTGPIARALVLLAIVITGAMYMFGQGHGHSHFAGLIFGGAICVGAVQWMAWAFGV